MPKNKLTDLNDHLFQQLEALDDIKLTGEKLQEEIQKANAIAKLGSVIVNNSKLMLDAAVAAAKGGIRKESVENFMLPGAIDSITDKSDNHAKS